MLDMLRRSSGGLIAKLFIGLLVLSFAVWGIADIFGGYGLRALATVGKTEISNEEFRQEFQQEMQRVGRQFGRTLSLEQARAIGLDQQVLGTLIANATLDNSVSALKVGVTNEAIARFIVNDPAFKDSAGNFNRSYFEQVLRSNGLSEAGYVQEQKRLHTRQQISSSVAGAAPAPKLLVDALHKFQQEQRKITYIVLAQEGIGPLDTPGEQALSEYFNNNKAQFRAPEYRRVELLALEPDSIAKDIDIAEDAIQALYRQRGEQLGKAEKREIQQIMFDSLSEAQTAAQRIAQGADFLEIAKEKGKDAGDISLGLIESTAIFDAKIRDAAFSLEEGKVSEPVQGAFGTALLRVVKIEAGARKSYEEARQQLRDELATSAAVDKVLDIHDKVEDERAAGSTFPEIARKLGVTLRVIDAVDASGNGADGNAIGDVPGANRTLQLAFQTNPGIEADPVTTSSNGYVWVNVTGITPDRERQFDEVRDKVAQSWREDQIRSRLNARSAELLDRLKKGETIEVIAREAGVPLHNAGPLGRASQDDTLPAAAIQSAFAAPVNGYAAARHKNGQDRLLMQVTSSEIPPLAEGPEGAEKLSEAIGGSIANTLLSQYISAKRDAFGVTINQNNLQQLLGER